MSHTDKYLKYKNKYLELKNQVGGYDTDSLNLPNDLLHSFFKAMLLFLNTISEKTVKYFHLLEITGIQETNLTNKNLDQIDVDNVAKKIAEHYKLQIFLPEHVDINLSKIDISTKTGDEKENWEKITASEHKYDVVILKDNDEYKLVNNQLIPYNDSIHSFFKAILLFLNNYLDHNITYFAFQEIVGKPNMFVGNENISEKIERYAQIIADKYQVAIEFFPIKNIDGTIGFLVDEEDYVLSNTILPKLPTDIEHKFVVMISRDYDDAKYNLIKTEITGKYKEED
jgi:hypothetical protein